MRPKTETFALHAGLHSLVPYFCTLILEELPQSIRSVDRSCKLLQVPCWSRLCRVISPESKPALLPAAASASITPSSQLSYAASST